MRTSVENEWLCARIVAAFGIPVANCEIGEFGAHKVLIVERFDRAAAFERQILAAPHAGGLLPGHRHALASQVPGGWRTGARRHRAHPARLAGIANAISTTLFRAQLLFFLLAATDGHAKNFSIRILAGGRFQLTPLYDVLSAWPVIGKKANEIPLREGEARDGGAG